MTRDFAGRGLIENTNVETYDGTTAVTGGAKIEPYEIERMRWRAERWMKVRHLPAVIRHDPMFVLRNGHRMLAHTFRGLTFARYRAIRARERDYVDWPDPLATSTDGTLAVLDLCNTRE
jgi:hypothetical protein